VQAPSCPVVMIPLFTVSLDETDGSIMFIIISFSDLLQKLESFNSAYMKLRRQQLLLC